VWDLAGSLGGTLTFGLFSFLYISPVIGIPLVVALVFLAAGGAHRRWMLPLYAVGLGAVAWSSQRDQTWWSP